MRVCLAILWKDLLVEWRSRDRVLAMLLFTLLVVVVFHFALPDAGNERKRELAPGLFWVATVLGALFGLGRSFSSELENEALSGLALVPVDRGWVFLGKAAANWMIVAAVQGVTALAFALVFDLELRGVAGRLAFVLALGALGLAGIGTLFSAVAVRTRFREVMLPLLLLPLWIPVLSGAVRATTALLDTGELPFEPVQLLIVADGVYLVVSFLLFDYVLDE